MKPQQRLFFLFAFLLLAGQALLAQSHTISGRITDEQNRQPLAFVNVVVNEGLTGTMSDINYDVNRCRNISLDVRYFLFIVDKFAGAQNIIDELVIK